MSITFNICKKVVYSWINTSLLQIWKRWKMIRTGSKIPTMKEVVMILSSRNHGGYRIITRWKLSWLYLFFHSYIYIYIYISLSSLSSLGCTTSTDCPVSLSRHSSLSSIAFSSYSRLHLLSIQRYMYRYVCMPGSIGKCHGLFLPCVSGSDPHALPVLFGLF